MAVTWHSLQHACRHQYLCLADCPPLASVLLQKIVVHGQYNPDTLANDIALLVLNRPAKTKPVLLPPPTYKLIPADVYEDGDWLFVAGFGSTEQGDTSRLL